jgi:hypothetical protein
MYVGTCTSLQSPAGVAWAATRVDVTQTWGSQSVFHQHGAASGAFGADKVLPHSSGRATTIGSRDVGPVPAAARTRAKETRERASTCASAIPTRVTNLDLC